MNGRSWDDVAKDVRHAATTRSYELPPSDHLAKPGLMLEYLALMSKASSPVHEVIITTRRRADIAEKNFGCDVNTAITDNCLRVLETLQNWDPENFRITNEKGFSPDLSKKVNVSRLAAYQNFRLQQFSQEYAAPWAIEDK